MDEIDVVLPETNPLPPDVLAMLLADKRSENTRRAYRYDLTNFFQMAYESAPTPDLTAAFLALSTPQMVTALLRYKARLIADGLAEATINRRLAAVMSLVNMARKVGATEANPQGLVGAEKVKTYRETRGISLKQARWLLRMPDRARAKGRRDYAMLLLLLENALRRAEIVVLDAGDFDRDGRSLAITGKGRGTQKERVTLSNKAAEALFATLIDRGRHVDSTAPLFVNVSRSYYGKRLTADGLYKIVAGYAKIAGLDQVLSPHRLRHTAITLALDSSGGDIRRVQRLSRHARLETLQIYDDNRTDLQGEMTDALSELLADDGQEGSP